MREFILISVQVNDENQKLCGKCDFRASDCVIFGFLKGEWKDPERHPECLNSQKRAKKHKEGK